MGEVTTVRPCDGPGCAELFEPVNRQQRYCSERCRKDAWRHRRASEVAEMVAEQVRRTMLADGLV